MTVYLPNQLYTDKRTASRQTNFVSMNGIEPLSKAYESFVLPLNYTDNRDNITGNCQKQNSRAGSFVFYLLRDHDLHVGLQVMSLPRYCFSIPLIGKRIPQAHSQINQIILNSLKTAS